MPESRQNSRSVKGDIIVGIMRVALYVLLFLVFFFAMSVNNWQLRHANRTLATMLVTYTVLAIGMINVYGGFSIGKRKPRSIVAGMALGTLVTDLVTYFQLEIMNVNSSKNQSLQLFGEDFPWFLGCFILQFAIIWIMVHGATALFFRLNPPKKGLLIFSTEKAKRAAAAKISRFWLQWDLTAYAKYDDPSIGKKINRAEAVFLSDGIPIDVRDSIIHRCYTMRRDVVVKAQLSDIVLSSANQIMIEDAPFYQISGEKISMNQRIIKRAMDIVVSALVLLVLSPMLAVIALCILIEDGKPVIFRQKRKTLNGKEFSIYKFRTMKLEECGSSHHFSATSDDSRITKTGKILRKFRLDEFPQFWNILKGDMSLVGPRPEMLENVDAYTAQLPDFALRESVKAGLTGIAQIEGKYNTSPEDKLMLDLTYIENYSLTTDIKLLFRTLMVFFKKDSTEGFSPSKTQDTNKKEGRK